MTSWFLRPSPDRAVRFEPWPGTLRCVLGQDTLLSQCLSLPRCLIGNGELNAGGNPAMDLRPEGE